VPGIDPALTPARQPGGSPFNTMHLWFLYQLFWFSVMAWAGVRLQRFVPIRLRETLARSFVTLAERRWGFAVLALPLALVGTFYPSGMVTESGSFLPPLAEWVQSGLFFVVGWYVHGQQERLLALFASRCKGHAVAGLAFLVATVVLLGAFRGNRLQSLPHPEFWIAFVYNATAWLWSLALIGGFVRYLPRQNAVLGVPGAHARHHRLRHPAVQRAPRRGREDGPEHRGHVAGGARQLPAAGAPHPPRHAAERSARGKALDQEVDEGAGLGCQVTRGVDGIDGRPVGLPVFEHSLQPA
jgi:hypothetical protein